MPVTDRVERLRQAARDRHDSASVRVAEALRALAASCEAISVNRVARVAGVSRSFVYNQPELLDEIDKLRRSRPARSSPARHGDRASLDSLRQQIHAHREELARLQAENRILKDQLARQLGAARVAAVTSRA